VDGNAQDSNGSLRRRVLSNEMNQKAFSLTQRRSFEESQSGGTPTFLTSLFKYYGSEHGNERMELQLEMMGHQGLGWTGESFDADEIATTRTWLRSKASTIAGGSSEVQLNIIAKRVLGLPD
ncbi:MAG: acyl-CoA dehydrogenase family protein, partial [Pseudomonadales bacterium]